MEHVCASNNQMRHEPWFQRRENNTLNVYVDVWYVLYMGMYCIDKARENYQLITLIDVVPVNEVLLTYVRDRIIV